jgi:hypothetical protein
MATALAGVGCLALAGGGRAEVSLAGVALALVAGAGYASMTPAALLLGAPSRPRSGGQV